MALLSLCFLLCHILLVYFAVEKARPYTDEGFHFFQIERFRTGEWRTHPLIATAPGYHAFMATLLNLTGFDSIGAVRGFTLSLGLGAALMFFLVVQRIAPAERITRTLQFLFFPIVFPHMFLVYTDVPSLLLVLSGTYALVSKRYPLAGLIYAVSLAVRQSNVVMLVFALLYSAFEDGRPAPSKRWFTGYLTKSWPFLLASAGFVSFVLLHGGIAIGDQRSHPVGLHLGNFHFALFSFFILFLPFCIVTLWSRYERLAHPAYLSGVLLLYLLIMMEFSVGHPYDRLPGYIKSWLLLTFESHPLLRHLYFVPAALGLAVLFVTPLHPQLRWALYGTSIMSVLGSSLVEPRYYFSFFSLFLLFREPMCKPLEWLTVIVYYCMAMYLLYGISTLQFGL